LEYKDRLSEGAWNVLPGIVFGTGTSVGITDTNAPSDSRFYRLLIW